jgi:hypothetical protein
MDKFSKRIKKLKDRVQNLLVIGDAWGNLPELAKNFDSIFIIGNQDRNYRAKNAVYREDFENISHIHGIDVILINLDQENSVKELLPVIKRSNPVILIQGPLIISKENQTFLKSHHYVIVEIHKSYFQWKLR